MIEKTLTALVLALLVCLVVLGFQIRSVKADLVEERAANQVLESKILAYELESQERERKAIEDLKQAEVVARVHEDKAVRIKSVKPKTNSDCQNTLDLLNEYRGIK